MSLQYRAGFYPSPIISHRKRAAVALKARCLRPFPFLIIQYNYPS